MHEESTIKVRDEENKTEKERELNTRHEREEKSMCIMKTVKRK